MGKVVGFHGLRGEMKVRPSTNNPDLLLDIEHVTIKLPSGQELEGTVDTVRLDRRLIVLSLAEYADRTAAESLTDAELYVSEDELAPLGQDEWWISDLVGLDAYTTTGERIGKIKSIIDGGNQILEIESAAAADGRTILVPFVKALVPTVDLRAQRVEVVDIPGLLEPQ